jgi:hypothetical protein
MILIRRETIYDPSQPFPPITKTVPNSIPEKPTTVALCHLGHRMELSCASHSGSVTHFYHFFFSCLVPLVYFRSKNPYEPLSFVTPVGQFRPIIDQLSLDLSYVPDENYKKLLLPSYDVYDNQYYRHPTQRYPSVPDDVRSTVINYIEKLSSNSSSHHQDSSRIILIERDHDPISHSSGYSRRHIRNHHQLKLHLYQKYSSSQFQNIYLERMPFLAQYQLFRTSSLIIAQHGAALSNIFFMKSLSSDSCEHHSHVIEISPPYSRRSQYFYNLADSLSVSYSSIFQERNRGNVSVSEVSAHIDCILSSWKEKRNQCDPHALGRLCGDIVAKVRSVE